jgi:hypothetical protein
MRKPKVIRLSFAEETTPFLSTDSPKEMTRLYTGFSAKVD